MASYDELKTELETIASLIEKFPELIKPKVYDLLVTTFLGKSVIDIANQNTVVESTEEITETLRVDPKPKKAVKTKTEKAGSRKASKENYQIDRDLILRGDKSIPSFKDFYEEKKPTSAGEVNVVGIYYLQKLLGMNEITLNHLYTCYKEVNHRPPEAFRQSITDTKNAKGWVEFDASGYLHIPHRGVIFVEHDLPKPIKTKKS